MSRKIKTVEIEGVRYTYVRDEDLGYSFDGGVNFAPTMMEAYEQASGAGALVTEEDDRDGASEFEAWVIGLLVEIQTMRDGETLRLVRSSGVVTLVKEQAVLAVRASSIREIDLRMEDGSGEEGGDRLQG